MTSTTQVSTATDRFLEAICGASLRTAEDLYSADVTLDATVPGWRFVIDGDVNVRAEYARWFNAPSEMTELVRHSTSSGEVVEYSISWIEDGITFGGHHVHVITIDPITDRIVSDHVWCGGRWPAPLLAEMDAARVVPQR